MVDIKRLKLINFQGIYTALGLKEIEIDRYKSNNNIILILGENGSGKTTILNELTPIPLEHIGFRNKSRIIPNTIGVKEIDFLLDGVILYKCKIVYDTIKNNTKCFITKIINNEENELNPNGNVNSYIEILDLELGFNKKYITVGYLSKSLTDFISMKATERSEYISEWLPNISEFIDAYKFSIKLMNKVKRDIENYNKDIGKISSVNYEVELNLLENQISNKNVTLDNIKSNIIRIETYITQLNKSLISRDVFISKLNLYKRNIALLNNIKYKLTNEFGIFKEYDIDLNNSKSIHKTIEKVKYELKTCEDELDRCEKNIFNLKHEIDSYNDTIKKSSIANNIDIKTISSTIEEMNKSLNAYEEIIDKTEVSFNIDYINVSDCDSLKSILDNIQNSFSHINETVVVSDYKSLSVLLTDMERERENVKNSNTLYDNIKSKLDKINSDIFNYENSNISKQILENRPEFCLNKYCNIVEELKKYIDPKYACDELKNEAKDLEKQLSDKNSLVAHSKDRLNSFERILNIVSELDNNLQQNKDLIGRFPDELTKFFKEEVLNINSNMNSILITLNDIKEYVSIFVKIKELKENIVNLTNTQFILNTKQEVKDKLQEKIFEYDSELTKKSELFKLHGTLSENVSKLENIDESLDRFNFINSKYDSDCEKMNIFKTNLEIYNKTIYYNKTLNDLLNKQRSEKLNIEAELVELNNKRDQMNTAYISKKQLEKMRNDLQNEHNRISILNQVWSIKVGYPALIIENFLNNLTIETNKDLSEMWGSSLKIEEFKLGSSEFNIIINRDGTIIEDASLCSDGEKSTLGLAISFAIIEMNMQERKYNVLRLDEVDSMLDDSRRRSFLDIIKTRLDDLDCKSCFTISHNKEYDDIECDVILLRGHQLNDTNILNKNIIFKL